MDITLTDALIVAGTGMAAIWLFLWYINTHPKGCCGIRRAILKDEDLPLNRLMEEEKARANGISAHTPSPSS
ncbi:MAG: hypothetical protein HN842_00415 [Gammaproteobacteria bacterium]|nr:hypothetical protein [Gammaproteobacteria bacterium]MBT7306644.1 hypothetical protein [Gammaproteobacteria bacterium]